MPDLALPRKGSRILFLGSQIATGGSQRVLLLQASWFFKRGYAAAAFFYDKENLLPLWRRAYEFPIYDLGFASPTDNLFVQAVRFLRGAFRLFRLLQEMPCTAIVTFGHNANLIGLPLAWLAGVPNRIASHRGKIEGFPRFLERIHAIMINSPITNCLVVVAERVREDAIAEGVQARRIVKIANGVVLPKVDEKETIQLRESLHISREDFILLSVGRLRFQKAHSVLLRALPRVFAQFPNTCMLIAGDGPLRQALQDEAIALGISGKVEFLGVRTDIPALMSLADLFIFPSRFEGMPNAVLEAMSHSLPVIATAVQGVDEVIRDGQNGLLVPLEDPLALSAGITRLIHDSEERQRLGSAARETIEKEYTVERMCTQYEKLLTANQARHS